MRNKLNHFEKFCSSCSSFVRESLTAMPPFSVAIHSIKNPKIHAYTGAC